MSFPRPCLTCGLATQPGKSRCPAHERDRERSRKAKRGPTPVANALRKTLDRSWLGGNCEACGFRYYASELRVDHIKPLADGGLDASANLQILCVACHRDKTTKENRER